MAIIKASWVDSQTTWLRASSKCNAIQDAVAQTNVTFDDRVRMCGYALTRNELQANDELRITIYWQIDSPALENDFSFVHLLGENFNPETGNPLWGQQDKQTPGEHALTTWVAGKLYRDVYVFRVAPHIPPGAYQLEIGWQDANGKRLTPRAIARGKDMAVSNLDALLISGLVVK